MSLEPGAPRERRHTSLRPFLRLLRWADRRGKAASARLMVVTRRSETPKHPKHLVPRGDSELDVMKSVWESRSLVLDLGSGGGDKTARLAEELDLVALDRAGEALTRGRLERRVVADLEEGLPIRSEALDGAALLDVVEHVSCPERLLNDVNRCLRDGGRIVATLPNANTPWKQRLRRAGLPWHADPDHTVEFTLAEARFLIESEGFRVLHEEPVRSFDTPLAGLLDLLGVFSVSLYGRVARSYKRTRLRRRPEGTPGWVFVAERRPPP